METDEFTRLRLAKMQPDASLLWMVKVIVDTKYNFLSNLIITSSIKMGVENESNHRDTTKAQVCAGI